MLCPKLRCFQKIILQEVMYCLLIYSSFSHLMSAYSHASSNLQVFDCWQLYLVLFHIRDEGTLNPFLHHEYRNVHPNTLCSLQNTLSAILGNLIPKVKAIS